MVVADVLEGVLTTISRYNMLTPGDRVIVAVSGGPDSTCLLHALVALAPILGVELAGVAHFNHRLRGAESDGDERFVAEMARRLGLRYFTASPAEPGHLENRDGNLENRLRRDRREFFSSLVAQNAGNCVALGHTRDDQAETVLFRLFRGAGLAGLAGILPATAEGVVRPLLGSTRAEAEQFLRARGIAWRQDSSNTDPRFARNRIRHRLLPQLEREWNPRLREALAHLAELAYEEERWWSRETGRMARATLQRGPVGLQGGPAGIELHAGELAGLPRAAARRLVREAIRQAKGDLRRVEFRHVEAVIDLAIQRGSGSGRMALPGLEVLLSFDWILLRPAGNASQSTAVPSVQVTAPGSYRSPGGNALICLEVSKSVPSSAPVSGAYATLKLHVPGSKAGQRFDPPRELHLRGWRAGDRYRPLGHGRDRKLAEMFQRARVPSWRRPFWPILSLGQQIVWASAFGVAAEFAANPAAGADVSKVDTGAVDGRPRGGGAGNGAKRRQQDGRQRRLNLNRFPRFWRLYSE
ncbi:MAG TPA: tRNA lysidine(34) synthetase TilS [Bryobacteraceae bacterium]|nr:tRNA lysidine(34) synthetase TilS [Bryobacteraceae bacterium]